MTVSVSGNRMNMLIEEPTSGASPKLRKKRLNANKKGRKSSMEPESAGMKS